MYLFSDKLMQAKNLHFATGQGQVLVMVKMALTRQEDRAMLESNPSAWRGSAGDGGGLLLIVIPNSFMAILARSKALNSLLNCYFWS